MELSTTIAVKYALTEGPNRGGMVNVGQSQSPPSHFILATGLTVTMVPKRNFVPVQVMVVFIPNEILLLVRNFILVSCKLKMNFVLD